jgi:extracellular factor (EF) 3-hydroxypalmitic acid methyl ester biosynthesis protein
LIYLLGLLDYFSVKHSAKIVSRLWQNVTSGGKLILTNAHASNPTRLWMEYVSEWYLLYKTKDEMYQIIDGLQSLDNVEYIMDEFSVYQYMILTKN